MANRISKRMSPQEAAWYLRVKRRMSQHAAAMYAEDRIGGAREWRSETAGEREAIFWEHVLWYLWEQEASLERKTSDE